MSIAKDPFAGLPGHLSPSQQEALENVTRNVIEEKLVVPAEEKVLRPEDQKEYDDVTLVRFLRARKWNVEGAMKQLRATSEWFINAQVDRIYDELSPDELEVSNVVSPQWIGCRDRRGRPVTVYRWDEITDERIRVYNEHTESLKAREHASIRAATTFFLPLANALPRPNPEVPIDRTLNLIDMTGVGLTGFWKIRHLLQTSTELATANIPEVVGKIFIIGAPAIWHIVYNIGKRWLDEGTAAKVEVLAPFEVFDKLSKEIDPKWIPKCYGGELDWHWSKNKGMPELDDDTKRLLGMESSSELPRMPLRYHHKTGLAVVGSGRTPEELKYNGRGQQMTAATEDQNEGKLTGTGPETAGANSEY